jgi:hypothetical protein
MAADTSPYFIERGGAGVPAEHLPKPTLALSARDSLLWESDMPVGAGGRTHGIRHQADVRFGHHRWPGWHLYKVQLASGCRWAVSPFRRLLPCRANWRYRRCQEAAVLRFIRNSPGTSSD